MFRGIACSLGVVLLFTPIARASDEPEQRSWAYSASLYGYDVPESQDYWNPNITADHGRLHLEARYNYESINTTSLWVGGNISVGESWLFTVTPMLGGVMGNLEGYAPGYRLSLTHGVFGLASEGEYFVDIHDREGSYFYSWNEAWASPLSWFRLGVASQRTRAFQSDVGIQRGLFVGFAYKRYDAAAYVFNLGLEDPTYVVSLRVNF